MTGRRGGGARALAGGLAVALSAGALSCGDPVHDDMVSALGPEAPGVSPGPLHRPGQPCLVCHGGSGPGPDFSAGGTVYAVRGKSEPLAGVTVRIKDADGKIRLLRSNSAGNFYLSTSTALLAYPFAVDVSKGALVAKMNTHVGRDGSCAACHQASPSPSGVGRVYLAYEAADLTRAQ